MPQPATCLKCGEAHWSTEPCRARSPEKPAAERKPPRKDDFGPPESLEQMKAMLDVLPQSIPGCHEMIRVLRGMVEGFRRKRAEYMRGYRRRSK